LTRALSERVALLTQIMEERGLSSRGVIGVRFGPYRVVEQIGAGGMAAVYSAVHEGDGTAVALKVLPGAWGRAPELEARLRREAEILRQVDHPHVVRVHAVGSVEHDLGGGLYVAMEWLPHGLDRVLWAQYPAPLGVAEALRIARGVADGLSAVHALGVIHRDVKPSNIMLRADGTPVLTDFGLAAARADAAGRQQLTPANVFVGTADYLAPEVSLGTEIDGRADLYALGVVLYEMLSGTVPFAGRPPLEAIRAHVEEEPPPLPPTVPATVRAIVERALRKHPEERYGSAAEMAGTLGAAARELNQTPS
jgi:serine/threonine protein kinase